MLKHTSFFLITAFWILMNALLWRSEFKRDSDLDSPVPVQVIWDKILTAPDDSAMEVVHRGKKVGYCRWTPRIDEGVERGNPDPNTHELEGMIRQPAGYRIELDGSVLWEDVRIRFDGHGEFSTNRVWNQFGLRTVLRPTVFELEASAADKILRFRIQDEDSTQERTFRFEDFQDPGRLLNELGYGVVPLSLGAPDGWMENAERFGVTWAGYHDGLRIGGTRVRVYRLEGQWLGKYRVVIFVSRAGEILRAELPFDVKLVNDALTGISK